jgi:hypothetical protein
MYLGLAASVRYMKLHKLRTAVQLHTASYHGCNYSSAFLPSTEKRPEWICQGRAASPFIVTLDKFTEASTQFHYQKAESPIPFDRV